MHQSPQHQSFVSRHVSPTTVARAAHLNPWICGASVTHHHCFLQVLAVGWPNSSHMKPKGSAFFGLLYTIRPLTANQNNSETTANASISASAYGKLCVHMHDQGPAKHIGHTRTVQLCRWSTCCDCSCAECCIHSCSCIFIF